MYLGVGFTQQILPCSYFDLKAFPGYNLYTPRLCIVVIYCLLHDCSCFASDELQSVVLISANVCPEVVYCYFARSTTNGRYGYLTVRIRFCFSTLSGYCDARVELEERQQRE